MPKRCLLTGGAGFIGSHLTEALVGRGDSVLVLDDLSTGRLENLDGAIGSGRVEFVEASVLDEDLVEECMRKVDACLHLASPVGVRLVIDRALESLLDGVRGSQIVIGAAARHRRPLLYASTSEIYGKGEGTWLRESSDRVVGSTSLARWNYSTMKAFGEALAFGYHRDRGARIVVARIFNTVGPRQIGSYGMVLPRFVRQALAGEELTVYGDGRQSRCFAHVLDTVDALVKLTDSEGAVGEAVNVGSPHELTILELAEKVIERTASASAIRLVPYAEAYGYGFEELGRRRPHLSRVEELTGWRPRRSVEEAIDDIVAYELERREEATGVVLSGMPGTPR